MKKQRIVLASVLKPVDDTRMFEKIGMSLAGNPSYEITIIGYPSRYLPGNNKINFLPHAAFDRLSLKRALISFTIGKKIYKAKPDALIVNTHELLIVAVAFRIFFGTRIIYDIQENYWRNILWTDTFPALFKHLLAALVRSKEIIFSRFFHLFFLAEKGFEKEMKFFRNNYVILENKCLLPSGITRTKSPDTTKLLFSGTISESTGVFQAIDLATTLHHHDQSVRLHIIGYCSLPATLKAVRMAIREKPFISLTGGDQLVPHSDIIAQLYTSDFGILYYPPSPHTENKIPTKLYEYLAAQLPLLMQHHTPWIDVCEPYKAAIPIDFSSSIDAAGLLEKMKQPTFFPVAPTDVSWSSEESKLRSAIDKFFV